MLQGRQRRLYRRGDNTEESLLDAEDSRGEAEGSPCRIENVSSIFSLGSKGKEVILEGV